VVESDLKSVVQNKENDNEEKKEPQDGFITV
jgi:hypothetical protein